MQIFETTDGHRFTRIAENSGVRSQTRMVTD